MREIFGAGHTAVSPDGEFNPSFRQHPEKSDLNNQVIRYSDILVQSLEFLGFKSAFGIPGGAIAGIFNSLCRSKVIQTSLCSHEGSAAYMALGRSLACYRGPVRGESPRTHEMGLCFSTSGPGITNLITGVAAAFEERVPIFVLTGNVSTQLIGRGAAQDAFETGINAVRMLESVTARSTTVHHAHEIIPTLLELFHQAVRTKLPVHLNVPTNLASEIAAQYPSHEAFGFAPTPTLISDSERATIDPAVRAFLASERPLIFAGHGIKTSGLHHQLKQAVEATGLPVIVTSHAKGIIPEDHAHYFGTFGFAATERATRFFKAYQPTAILFLGTRLTEPSSAGWSPLLSEPSVRVHVDSDEKQLNRIYPVTHPVRADLKDFLLELTRQANQRPATECGTTHPEVLRITKAHQPAAPQRDLVPRMTGPVDPAALMQTLDFWLPDDVILFSDIGNTMAWAIHHLQLREGQDFYLPLGLGSMGSGICGAIGAKSANPGRPVICLAGDCTTLMHGTELFTAKTGKIGIKLIVLNDSGHGMVDHGHRLLGLTDVNVRFKDQVNFKSFAESMGVQAYRAENLQEFVRLPLDELFRSPDPVLIEVIVDPKPVPPILSRTRVLGQSDRSAT